MPSTYILDDNDPNREPLILDCIYDVDTKESGFVLKWYLNNIQIYQWIPSRPVVALVSFNKSFNPLFFYFIHIFEQNLMT